MNNKDKQIQSAIVCSESMLKDAAAGNWNKVIDIEVKRSELLEQLFSGSIQHHNVVDIDNKIQKIIDINKQLEKITLKARENSRSEISTISKGRHAVNMYAMNSA